MEGIMGSKKDLHMKKNLRRYALVLLYLAFCICTAAHGMIFKRHPEVDPNLTISALTLLGGLIAVLRARRKNNNR
jgi:hypothetical protein